MDQHSVHWLVDDSLPPESGDHLPVIAPDVAIYRAVNPPDSEDARGIQAWLTGLWVRGIEACSTEEDRLNAIAWVALAREILNDEDRSKTGKAQALYQLVDMKDVAQGIFRGVATAAKSYWQADLPWAIKVAVPATLAVATVVGGQGAGIVAFGSGIGVPVLLLFFLGTAGLTSVLEAVLSKPESLSYLSVVLALIARDATLLKTKAWLREAMSADIVEPKRYTMPKAEAELRARLLAMNCFDFECHVMSFFQQQGLMAWNTQKSNDGGVDGFARHQEGLIVVQCKHFVEDKVGRPDVQQFKGVIEENGAYRGYLVTTSSFSEKAQKSAAMNDKIILVDMDGLIAWHQGQSQPLDIPSPSNFAPSADETVDQTHSEIINQVADETVEQRLARLCNKLSARQKKHVEELQRVRAQDFVSVQTPPFFWSDTVG